MSDSPRALSSGPGRTQGVEAELWPRPEAGRCWPRVMHPSLSVMTGMRGTQHVSRFVTVLRDTCHDDAAGDVSVPDSVEKVPFPNELE